MKKVLFLVLILAISTVPSFAQVNPCDPACEKIIIDSGMSIEAALLYAERLDGIESIGSLHPAAARFYARVVIRFEAVAQAENSARRLTPERQAALMAQIDLECYRADEMIAWSRRDNALITPAAVALWTNKIFGWAKQDQDFYTAFAAGKPTAEGAH